MNNCLNCNKEVHQTSGKKAKKYCDASCRQKHWQKLKAEGKGLVKLQIPEDTLEHYSKLSKLRKQSRNEMMEQVLIDHVVNVDYNLPEALLACGAKRKITGLVLTKGGKNIDFDANDNSVTLKKTIYDSKRFTIVNGKKVIK